LAAIGVVLLIGVESARAAASSYLATNASPNTTVGYQVYDHTNLSGASPTGTISFALYGPDDATCSSPIFTATVPVSGTGSDDSPRFTTPNAGTYRWTAAYSGDDNNSPYSTACGEPSQTVIVDKRWPAAILTASQSGAVLHATLDFSGGYSPTGTATFTAYDPADTFCSGPPVYTSTVTMGGPGIYNSGSFRASVSGTYKFRLRYDGDDNNFGVGPTGCNDQNASVVVGQALFTNPSNGQRLDTTRPFGWTPVSGAQRYGVTVGTSRGGRDIVNTSVPGTSSSLDVSMLPTGRTLYARIWTQLNGAWSGYQDVAFTTSGQGAEFSSPADGDQAATTHFTWRTVSGAEAYGLWVGTSPRTADLASVHTSSATSSYDVAALPAGQKLYARVWTKINGTWARYQDITFASSDSQASALRHR
jgi:hypothetical protein